MKFAVLLGSVLILWPLWASAAPPPVAVAREVQAHERPRTSPNDVQSGALLFYDEDVDVDGWLAPQLTNQVDIRVTGLIARARVAQTFENLSDEVVHAVYVFPLPETAAVDGLELTVGKRHIVGQIQERAAAARSYAKAQSQGKKASLVEQERPNLFTTRVANIGPHETVRIQLSYQQDVRYDAGTFSLEFPSTLTPRYAPGPAEAGAGNLTPPVALDGDGPTLELTVSLDAGMPLERVTSPSHRLAVTKRGQGLVRVALEEGEVLADRDFRLDWAPAPSSAPSSAVFEEEFGGERYALLMLLPPAAASDPRGRLPRETSFIIDTSGSMSGTSIEQARVALESGLGKLLPEDRFNVIEFNSTASALFEQTVPATPEHVQQALRWVRQLQADGGTEMLPALDLALSHPAHPDQLSQVVFITDGSVGNEAEVFRFLEAQLAGRRLFTVGIGSAPNQYFLRSAARFGRGTFTSVASAAEVASRMNELWTKLSTPVMSQLGLDFPGDAQAETWPERVPDLYRGEPLVVVAKLDAQASSARIYGRRLGQPFAAELPLLAATAQASLMPGAQPGALAAHKESGIHRLWARRKIEALMDRMVLAQSEEQLRPEVTQLALEHHLLSKYTSLVAVDRVRSVEGEGSEAAVANALPAGNDMFGNMPQTATPAPTCLLLGGFSFLAAAFVHKRQRPC